MPLAFLGDPDAVVLDLPADERLIVGQPDRDPAARARVLDGVRAQVEHDLPQKLGVGEDIQDVLGHFHGEPVVLLVDLRLQVAEDGARQPDEIDRLDRGLHPAALQPRHVQQVIDELDETLRRPQRVLHVALRLLPHLAFLDAQLQHPLDPGQRRAQLVGRE